MEDATNAPAFALGIDVSKRTLAVTLIGSDQKQHAITTGNDTEGFCALLDWLEGQLPAAVAPRQVHACLEASGGYEEEAARFLYEHDLLVSVVNPRRLSAYAESQLRRSKTDAVDAALLARFCQRERPYLYEPPEEAQEGLREMTRGLQALKKERDRLENQRDRADHEAVTNSLGEVLREITNQIEELERKIDAHIQSAPKLRRQCELLESIPGVGQLTAARVLAELGDPSRFESARQAAAYAGLVPSHHESGDRVHKRSTLSKIGCARLRKALYFPAITALHCNAAIAAFGKRLEDRGKERMVIVGAAMRKLLHICYGVLKNEQPFDASLHPGT